MSEGEAGRVHLEVDHDRHLARLTIDRPDRKNAYDPPMREQMRQYLHEVADDDDIKVLVLRGDEDLFTTGADMANAYAWYGGKKEERRPSQRRRLAVDRVSFGFYHDFLYFPKVTVAQVETYALGGGFELALMADLAVVGRGAKLGMPGAQLLGETLTGAEVEHLGLFTEVCDDDRVAARAEHWADRVTRMPADGLAIAKTGFNLVEQTQGYVGEEATGFLMHAFSTNLRFEEDEFNFVKERARHGTSAAFKLRDEHFTVPSDGA